jgi:hypothetical protein
MLKSKLSAALAAACITVATILAPAQGRADFIFPTPSVAANPGFFGGTVSVVFNPSSFNLFDTSLGTLTDVDIILSFGQGPFGQGVQWIPTFPGVAGLLTFDLSLNNSPAGCTIVAPGFISNAGFFGLPAISFFEGTGSIPFQVTATADGTLLTASIGFNVRYTFTPRCCSRSHRRCWPAGRDLGKRWSSRLVATATENRLNIPRTAPGLRQPPIAEQSRFMSTRP